MKAPPLPPSTIMQRSKPCLPDAAHVEVGDLNNLGEAKHARAVHGLELLLGNAAERADKMHDGLAAAGTNQAALHVTVAKVHH